MPRGFLLKMRSRMAPRHIRRIRLKKELTRLERIQDRLEGDIDTIREEIEMLEK